MSMQVRLLLLGFLLVMVGDDQGRIAYRAEIERAVSAAELDDFAVVAGHFTDNPASGRVLEKAGFLYTGEVRAGFSKARGDEAHTRRMVWLA